PRAKAAHSIYFEMLGGAGFVGLAFYLALLAAAFFKSASLQQLRDASGARDWRARFGYYAQISLAVFCVGGASTSLEMWDGYLIIIALTASVGRLASTVAPRGAKASVRRPSWRGGVH